MSKSKESIWPDIEKTLNELDKSDLIILIKDLYGQSTDIEMIIDARFSKNNRRILENYRKKIIKAFMTGLEPPELPKIKDGMNAIKDYKIATKDLEGVIDLSITYCEQSIDYSNEYCYCEEDIEDGVNDIMQDLKQIIEEDKSGTYLALFREDLLKLYKLADKAEDYMFEEFIGDALEDLGIKKNDNK
ncbi:MAG: hypothetical protein PHC34_06195 [Candidatus Gastranaerophilales bacterium]|nr:hypothetical protein [Candidatus Gastranaerophilales bacterium]